MDANEVIFTRHSIAKVRPDPIPRAIIEQLLSAAVQAPNHFRVRPWRFIVLSGEARNRLGEVMAQAHLQRHPDATEMDLNVEKARPLRAPVMIAVGVDRPAEAKVIEIENICAASAAVENLLLAANALGLGAMWRTGPAAREAAVKQFLGLEAEQELIAFIYLGYPEAPGEFRERPSFKDRTVWFDD
jgi:nitroreductase